jgi:hypothetical protein
MDRIIQPQCQLFATDGWSHFYLFIGLNRGKFPCGISKYKSHGSTGHWVHTIYQNLSCWHNNPRQACNFSWRENNIHTSHTNNILLTQTYTCFWLLTQDTKYYCRLTLRNNWQTMKTLYSAELKLNLKGVKTKTDREIWTNRLWSWSPVI